MALVKKYYVEVVDIQNPLKGIYVISFKSLLKPFTYLPGQFLHVTLDEYNPSRPWPESRCFSMQTNQDDEILKITYTVKGSFTERMERELEIGKCYWLKMPFGEIFYKGHNTENCVFIAGGTGITPFLSLFTSKEFCAYLSPVLYFGLRTEEYNIYESSFEKARKVNNSFGYNILFDDSAEQLDIKNIFEKHGTTSTYFLSGPPLMIKSFKEALLSFGVNDRDILTDDWE